MFFFTAHVPITESLAVSKGGLVQCAQPDDGALRMPQDGSVTTRHLHREHIRKTYVCCEGRESRSKGGFRERESVCVCVELQLSLASSSQSCIHI